MFTDIFTLYWLMC